MPHGLRAAVVSWLGVTLEISPQHSYQGKWEGKATGAGMLGGKTKCKGVQERCSQGWSRGRGMSLDSVGHTSKMLLLSVTVAAVQSTELVPLLYAVTPHCTARTPHAPCCTAHSPHAPRCTPCMPHSPCAPYHAPHCPAHTLYAPRVSHRPHCTPCTPRTLCTPRHTPHRTPAHLGAGCPSSPLSLPAGVGGAVMCRSSWQLWAAAV